MWSAIWSQWMRKTDIVMLAVSYLLFIGTWAAAAENQPPLSGRKAVKNSLEATPDGSTPPRLKERKRIKRPRDVMPKASRVPSESLAPRLDEKNLGLGCSKP